MTKSALTAISPKPLPEDTHSCWSCGSMRAAHFCGSCGKVQPPVPVDYFTFFGLPPKLNVNVAALEKSFYELSRKLHPDLNARAGTQEQEWSMEQSSLLNDAYRTLKDPIKRTAYLLHLQGVELEEQSKTATEQARATGEIKKQIVPPDLLEEVFELNMQLEEMRMNQKMGEDDPALQADLAAARDRFEAMLAEGDRDLAGKGAEWDSGDAATREKAAAVMAAMLDRRRYLRNLVRDVNEVL